MEWYRLPVPAHMKIDVDGTERAVLAGAAATLRDPGVKSVMIESGAGAEKEEFIRFFEQAGLKFTREFDKQNPWGRADVFFARDPVALGAVLSKTPERTSCAELKKVGA